MTAEEYTRRRFAIEAWAQTEIDRLIYPKAPGGFQARAGESADAREAYYLMAMQLGMASEIEKIEIIAGRVLEAVDQDFHGMPRLDPETGDPDLDARVCREIERWEELWQDPSRSQESLPPSRT